MTRLNLTLSSGLAAIYLLLNAAALLPLPRAEAAPPAPRASAKAAPPPFLWKIEGSRPSWFFGTVHSDDPRVAALPAPVVSALAASRTFHPELELNAELSLALAAKLFQADTPNLSTRLKPALWKRVEKAGAALGLPTEMLQRLTPAFAALLFSAPPIADVGATLDGRLYEQAHQRGLAIVALETPDQQLAVFEKLSESQAVAILTEALDENDAARPTEKKLIAAYASGDENAVTAIIDEEFSRSPASRTLADPLLYARNRAMADALAPHLQSGGAFVAIGVGHLCGPRSVLALLRARGWKITRVAAP